MEYASTVNASTNLKQWKRHVRNTKVRNKSCSCRTSNYKTGQQKILHHNTRDSENWLRRVCQYIADKTLHVHTVLRQLYQAARQGRHHKMLRQKLVQRCLKLFYCYWQRPMIVYCHQHRQLHRPIHIPQLNFRYQRFDSMASQCYTFLSHQDRSARFRTYVFYRCRYVLAFSVLAYSISAYPYLSFPYLRFPPL